jgi:hypothetical protein
MTVLNFAITQDGVFVVMDTLVTCDNGPAFFTSKATPVPHLNGLICGTGFQRFFHLWSLRVLGGIVSLDISHLDQYATENLREVWDELPDEQRRAGTSTIYHFGYDRCDDEFVGYAYRSTNDFESEQLPCGIATKPPYLGNLPLVGFPDDFVEVCRAQRTEQDQIASEDRVYMGGQVTAYTMQRNQRREGTVWYGIETAHEFEDFDEMYVACLDNLPQD